MNRILPSVISATLLLSTPLAVRSAETGSPNASGPKVTMMCRPATKKDTSPNAVVMMGKTPVVCKTVTPAMMHAIEAGPALTASMTAMQVSEAWKRFIDESVFAL